ncbi:MAG: hypothetical protein ISS82_05995 [Nanoarchaeota archaeon]|nr:hypothetical protein [Nanoarchaeota archaeon]
MAKDKIQEIVGAIVGIIFLFYLSQVLFKELSFGPLFTPGLFVLMLFVLFIGFIIVVVAKIKDLF